MAEIPYVINTGKIAEYFATISNVGIPPKVTNKYLESLGFKSKNDRYLVGFLRDLGFIDQGGVPTQRWADYRHTDTARAVMATAIRESYEGLFQMHPDAHQKDDEAIRNWMRSHASSASPVTIDRALGTFKAIVGLADFDADLLGAAPGTAGPIPRSTQVHQAAPLGGLAVAAPAININIQLTLPETATADDYENFFSAMRSHLFDAPPTDS